jgi:hypothetical protein
MVRPNGPPHFEKGGLVPVGQQHPRPLDPARRFRPRADNRAQRRQIEATGPCRDCKDRSGHIHSLLMILAPLIVAKGQTDQAAPATKWVAGILSAADRRILTAEDVARIESYEGDGRVLHDMMRTILPLPRAIWYEATSIADRGMQIVHGYAIAPAPGGGSIMSEVRVLVGFLDLNTSL